MGFKITIGGADFTSVITGTPQISDQLNANCRVLTFNVEQLNNPQDLLSYEVALQYNGATWFKGEVKRLGTTAEGNRTFTCYDPLFYFSRNPDDYYFKNQTGNQIIVSLAKACGIKTAAIANTGVTFPYLYYKGAKPDKIAVDVLARTHSGNGKKFWYRYDPVADGLTLFERKIAPQLWAFQLGVNILSASKEDSVEDMCTVVKVINRETGAVSVKSDAKNKAYHGTTQYFEEVNNDVKNLDAYASEKLKELNKVSTTMTLTGINPNAQMGQFYVGDAIYVEEPNTGMAGGYYIKNVTHTFLADDMIKMDFDLQYTPDLPAIQFQDADKKDTKK